MQESSKWVQPTDHSSEHLLSPQERCEELDFRPKGRSPLTVCVRVVATGICCEVV